MISTDWGRGQLQALRGDRVDKCLCSELKGQSVHFHPWHDAKDRGEVSRLGEPRSGWPCGQQTEVPPSSALQSLSDLGWVTSCIWACTCDCIWIQEEELFLHVNQEAATCRWAVNYCFPHSTFWNMKPWMGRHTVHISYPFFLKEPGAHFPFISIKEPTEVL